MKIVMPDFAVILVFISVGMGFVVMIFMRNKDYVLDKDEKFKAERMGKDLDKILTKTGYKIYIVCISIIMVAFISIAIWAISRWF